MATELAKHRWDVAVGDLAGLQDDPGVHRVERDARLASGEVEREPPGVVTGGVPITGKLLPHCAFASHRLTPSLRFSMAILCTGALTVCCSSRWICSARSTAFWATRRWASCSSPVGLACPRMALP